MRTLTAKKATESHGDSEKIDRRSLAYEMQIFACATRLRILDILRDGDFSVNEIVKKTGMAQPTISHQLRLLRHAGVVELHEQVGSENYYVVHEARLSCIFEDLEAFLRRRSLG